MFDTLKSIESNRRVYGNFIHSYRSDHDELHSKQHRRSSRAVCIYYYCSNLTLKYKNALYSYSVQSGFVNQTMHMDMYNGNNMPVNHYMDSGQVIQVELNKLFINC